MRLHRRRYRAAGGADLAHRLATRLALEPSTITPLVKRLEQAGFIARQRNPADERQVVVSLTPQGKALRAESGCLTETLLQRSGLTVEQIVDLNDRVRALNKALTDHMPD